MDGRTLKRKAEAVAKAYDARDQAIREAHGDGMSLRQIANAVGMSHSGVKRIVDSGANSVGAA